MNSWIPEIDLSDTLYSNIQPLKENNIEPFPVQRMKWFETVFSKAKPIFNHIRQIRKDIPNTDIQSLITLTDTGDIVESELQTLKTKYVDNSYVDSALWDLLIKALVYNITFMYNWSMYKQSYRFDKDVFQLLCNDTDISQLPLTIIKDNLPYYSFFIDNRFIAKDTHKIFRGCYVSIVPDTENRPELGLFFVEDNEESDYEYCLIPLYMGDSSLIDIMEKRNKLYNINTEEVSTGNILDIGIQALQCIIYICSANKEIETIRVPVNTKNNNHKKPKSNNKKAKTISQNLVGYRMGNTIRQNKKVYVYNDMDMENSTEINTDNECKPITRKSPHMRMAHYHHYWTGPKNDPSQRKLIVKFIPPLYINSNLDDGDKVLRPTLHNVK